MKATASNLLVQDTVEKVASDVLRCDPFVLYRRCDKRFAIRNYSASPRKPWPV